MNGLTRLWLDVCSNQIPDPGPRIFVSPLDESEYGDCQRWVDNRNWQSIDLEEINQRRSCLYFLSIDQIVSLFPKLYATTFDRTYSDAAVNLLECLQLKQMSSDEYNVARNFFNGFSNNLRQLVAEGLMTVKNHGADPLIVRSAQEFFKEMFDTKD